VSPLPDPAYDLRLLTRGLKPWTLHWFTRLRSTNDHAAVLRKRRKLFAPAVILTGRQTAGRGRGSNRWWSDTGALTVTFVLAADEHLPAGELPLIAGLAVRDAAAELTGRREIELKWPNDVLFENLKLAGLLCERIDRIDLIGVGLNVNLLPSKAPPSLRGSLTSLLAISGREMDRNQTLLVVASHLRQAMLRRKREPFSHFLREYQRRHCLTGRKVQISSAGHEEAIAGRVEGVDGQARLLVREGAIMHRVVAGTVREI
jgi:BirA family transcriptional regulator, biotin operon repressor / biotin---[acetyl-CoA-carboxylase] ligase